MVNLYYQQGTVKKARREWSRLYGNAKKPSENAFKVSINTVKLTYIGRLISEGILI